ncbi:MAG: hypothetical protein ACTSRF_16500 [Candidatus Freyarchaeota archaeon]
MNNKKFDAVRMMREIRDKLSKRYARNPEAEKRDLEDIRRKYGISFYLPKMMSFLKNETVQVL